MDRVAFEDATAELDNVAEDNIEENVVKLSESRADDCAKSGA